MVWECFSSKGVGPLHRIDGTMDRWVYHTILTQKAMKHIRKLMAQYPEVHRWTFAADNDPKHGAIENKNYLHKQVQEAGGRLKLMQWPS